VKTLATYSIKGGVGKTTTAVNLAAEAARGGARTLLWDLDPQGAATFLARVKPRLRGGSKRLVRGGELDEHLRGCDIPGVDVVPADFSLRNLDLHLDGTANPTDRLRELLAPVADAYDVAMLDCAPSISLASESIFGAADALIVPVVPAALASRTLEQLQGFLADQDRAPLVLPVLSLVDRRRKAQRDLVDQLVAAHPALLETEVASSAVIERMGEHRAPVGAFAPRSAAAATYHALWQEIAHRLWA
jgi:cellulose biosynthesis protein BcsQ